jgi:prevent-host-death family protein
LISMVITAKELRLKTSKVLKDVQRLGSVTVTLRGKPVAKLVSVAPRKEKKLSAYRAIGMWADREDMKDVDAWVRKLRKPRYLR